MIASFRLLLEDPYSWSRTDRKIGLLAVDQGSSHGAQSNDGELYAHAIILTYEFIVRATYVLENTLGANSGIGSRDNQWYSITNYLFYEINECWDAGLRIEWFRDKGGQRVNVNGAGPGSFYEATVGLKWIPHPSIAVRPEVRWDWFTGQGRPFDSRDGGMSGTLPTSLRLGLIVCLHFELRPTHASNPNLDWPPLQVESELQR